MKTQKEMTRKQHDLMVDFTENWCKQNAINVRDLNFYTNPNNAINVWKFQTSEMTIVILTINLKTNKITKEIF